MWTGGHRLKRAHNWTCSCRVRTVASDQGLDKQLGPGHRRLLMRCSADPQGAAGSSDRRLRKQRPQLRETSCRMQVDGLLQGLVSDACSGGSVEGRKRASTGRQEIVSLVHRRSEVTWDNGVLQSGSLFFADTEEVTGSNPVAPTRHNASLDPPLRAVVSSLSADHFLCRWNALSADRFGWLQAVLMRWGSSYAEAVGWSWAGSSSGAGPPRTAAPGRSWRSWPRSWGRASDGRRRRRPGRRAPESSGRVPLRAVNLA